MAEQLPRSPHTHLCAACYARSGRRTPATWVTIQGYCVCDNCVDDVEQRGEAALTPSRKNKRA